MIPKKNNEIIKLIFAQSFSIYPPCFIHDNLMALSLEMRGAEIIPVYCDCIQSIECNVFGGVWGGGDNFKRNCSKCLKQSQKLLENNNNKIKLSNYLLIEDKIKIKSIVRSLKYGEWCKYVENSLPLGEWSKNILVNNYLVADYNIINNYEYLGKSHLSNLLLLKRIYERILNDVKPDRVVSNDSFYGMWALWEALCKKKNIHFYSHWAGGKKNSWCYAYNDAAMNLNFKLSWKNFSKKALDKNANKKVKEWIINRTKGFEMILDAASASLYKTDNFDLSLIDRKKPTALLSANVIWDLAALNKQIVFKDMIDWIVKTVEWFRINPEFQLIIKPHPIETHPTVPKTLESVEFALTKRNISMPKNVFLLSSKVKYTVYDFFPLSCVGIVHTSTVGLEMAAKGLPVITTAKSPYRGFGFTYDPENKEQYFIVLKEILKKIKNIDINHQQNTAYKFILFYFYHYYSNIGIMENEWGKEPKLKIKSLKDIKPGKNIKWDYFVNAIINGKPIISETVWPPESE